MVSSTERSAIVTSKPSWLISCLRRGDLEASISRTIVWIIVVIDYVMVILMADTITKA